MSNEDLYQLSPYNAIRLEYGETSDADTPADNRYTRAAADLHRWLADGVLLRDTSPALYVYEQRFTHQGQYLTRRAFFARVRLHNWDDGIIRPHERTLSRPKEDRLSLLRACRVNTAPFSDSTAIPPAKLTVRLEKGAVGRLFEATDAGRAEPSPASASPITRRPKPHQRPLPRQEASTSSTATTATRPPSPIATRGAPRRRTGVAKRQRTSSSSPSSPRRYPGLVVLPTHRLLQTADVPADFDLRLSEAFHLEDVSDGLSAGWTAMEALLAEAGRHAPAIGIATRAGNQRLIATVKDPDKAAALMPPDRPATWRHLDAALLQDLILQRILGISEQAITAAAKPPVEFVHDGEEALRQVESGQYALAFFLNPTPTERVLEVADAGERMPQKSTYFYPKLPTGLVMYPLD